MKYNSAGKRIKEQEYAKGNCQEPEDSPFLYPPPLNAQASLSAPYITLYTPSNIISTDWLHHLRFAAEFINKSNDQSE